MSNSQDRAESDARWFKVLPPVLLCACLWGSAFPAIKTVYRIWDEMGVKAGLADRWCFAGIRFLLAGGVLLLVARNPWREMCATPKLGLIRFALFQTTGQYLFFYWGMALASGSLAGLLVSSGSFWWMLFAPLLAGVTWPSVRQWVAVGVGAVGLFIATTQPGSSGEGPWLGACLLLLSTAFGSLGLIEFGRLRPTIGARAATGFSLLGGGLLLLVVGMEAAGRMLDLMSPKVIVLTVWLAFVSAAAFSLWNHLSTRFPVPLLAGYRFLIPLAGMLESLLFLPEETASVGLTLGALLIVVSLVLAQRWQTTTSASPILPRR